MITSGICPLCGGKTLVKEVTEVIRGGGHTASIRVQAEVCEQCGERLYTPEVIRHFEEIKAKLQREETEEFEPIGTSFQVI
ncbi:MAG: YgiT-type zinc finger protein [Halothece sp.]